MVDFIFVVIELFRYLLRLRRYERKSVEVGVFGRGWVTLSADFRGKGASPTNHCYCQKTRVIAVSCGIKIFAVRCLVFSQYTHLTDRRTDGQTDGQTEFRQQYRALHYMQSHGKNCLRPEGYFSVSSFNCQLPRKLDPEIDSSSYSLSL